MGYNSGRTGDETKTLLNKVENHALYKGTATLAGDTPQSIGEDHLIVGTSGNNCEVTDLISNTSLRGKVLGVGVNSNGYALLQELPPASDTQAGVINTEAQTFAGLKTFANIKTSQLVLHNSVSDSDVALTNSPDGELFVGINKVSFDGDVVHKADNETITGIKTIKTDAGGLGFAVRTDNTNIKFTANNSGPAIFNLLSGGTESFPTTGTNPMGNLKVTALGYLTMQDGYGFSYLRLPSQKGSSGNAAVLAVDSDVIHKTGDEQISGNKTFTTGGGINTNVVVSGGYGSQSGYESDAIGGLMLTGAASGLYGRATLLLAHASGGSSTSSPTKIYLPNEEGTLATTDDVPSNYIKSAAVSGSTLTLTTEDDTTISYHPTGTGSIGWGSMQGGSSLGSYYYLDAPNNEYSIQLGEVGFTLDYGETSSGADAQINNVFSVSSGFLTLYKYNGYNTPATNILTVTENTFSYKGSVVAMRDNVPYKVATSVTQFNCAKDTAYIIVNKGGGYVTMGSNQYYGTFFLTFKAGIHRRVTSTTGAVAIQPEYETTWITGGQLATSAVGELTGSRFETEQLLTLTINCTGGTMDIYKFPGTGIL